MFILEISIVRILELNPSGFHYCLAINLLRTVLRDNGLEKQCVVTQCSRKPTTSCRLQIVQCIVQSMGALFSCNRKFLHIVNSVQLSVI